LSKIHFLYFITDVASLVKKKKSKKEGGCMGKGKI